MDTRTARRQRPDNGRCDIPRQLLASIIGYCSVTSKDDMICCATISYNYKSTIPEILSPSNQGLSYATGKPAISCVKRKTI